MHRYIRLLLSLLIVFSLASSAAALPFAPLPERSVLVTVAAHDGKPLLGANVHLLLPGQTGLVTARTDVRGQAGLTLPPGFTYWLRIWADGHRVAEVPYVPAADGYAVTIQLEPYGATLMGTVTDEKGRPVSGATLSVWQEGAGFQGRATTGADGTYQLPGIPTTGTVQLQVEAKAFQPYAQSGLTFSAARTVVDVELTPAGDAITGEVVDSRTGLPVRNVRAELLLSGWGVAATAETDSYGFFRLEAPAAADGSYQIRLRSTGYEMLTTAPFTATAGGWTDYTGEDRLQLNPLYAELSGMILSDSGFPQGSTKVELQLAGLGTVETLTTDADGFFAFTKIPAGTYRVRALPDHLVRGDSGWINLVGGDQISVDVVAGNPDTTSFGGSAITGTVRDNLGRPVAGATVTLHRAGRQTTQTDSQGRYRFSILANIEDKLTEPKTATGYHLSVAKAGYISTDLWQSRDGELTPGLLDVRQKSTGRADFTLHPSHGELTGLVLDDRGQGLEGVQVVLRQEGAGTVGSTRTDASGRYRFPDLEVAKQARYLPVVLGGGYVESAVLPNGSIGAPISLTPGAAVSRTIAARPADGTILGTATAGANAPAAGATVRAIRPADGRSWSAEVREDGTYSLPVPAGPGSQYLVQIYGENLRTTSVQGVISLTDNYGATANLAAAPGATITGRVYDALGQPLANRRILIWAEGEASYIQETQTNALGTYKVEGLTPGRRYAVATVTESGDWSWIAPGEPILTPLAVPAPGELLWADLLAPAPLPLGIR